jgi:hypothetical protein
MNRELSGSRSAQFGIGYAHRIEYDADGAELHFHSGFTAGYTATILWRERPKVGLVLLSNRGRFGSLRPMGRQLLGVIAEQLEHPRRVEE